MGAPLDIDQAARLVGYRIAGTPIRGGMSTVYPAIRTSETGSAPTVAIKLLRDDATRLQREAELLRSVDHPAIAEFIELGELALGAEDAPRTAFLASAWIPGNTLHATQIDGGPLSVDNGLAIFEAIAGGLQHLHDNGIVHRDLSPNNIIVGPDANAQVATLIDFGISRSQESAHQTVGTDLAGTPRYLAPEVISGADPSPASDQYSTAIVVYEMLTGSWPYPESPTAANALHHQMSTAPTPLLERLPDAPVALDQAIQRALAKDPAHRFASMDDFVQAIHQPSEKVTERRLRDIAAVAVVAALAIMAAGFVLITRGSEPTVTGSDQTAGGEWAAGDAAAMACNMLEFVDFDDRVLPRNWYLNPIDEAGVDVVDNGGQDDTPALRVGFGERYGLWGEDAAVEPGAAYIFAGTFISEGAPFAASITIDWYDAESNPLPEETATVDLTELPSGRVSLTSTAPGNARFAVVQVFKDASSGSLLADELVLARADDRCTEAL